MLPRRHKNSGKADKDRRFPTHMQWVRGFVCICFKHGGCEGKTEAAHVDYAGGKGMSIKVADYHVVPMCSKHHQESHQGVKTFEAKYGVSMLAEAEKLAKVSPKRHLWADRA